MSWVGKICVNKLGVGTLQLTKNKKWSVVGEARNNKPKFGQKYKILISDLCSCVPRHQFVGTLLPGIEFEQLNWSSESRNYFCLYIYLAYEYRAGAVQYNYATGGQRFILGSIFGGAASIRYPRSRDFRSRRRSRGLPQDAR